MRKETEFVIIVICINILLILGISAFTGWVITSIPRNCKDKDGENYYLKGELNIYTELYGEPILESTYIDYCATENVVVEYYCEFKNNNYLATTKRMNCEYGCVDGACVKSRVAKSEDPFVQFYEYIKKIFTK